MKDIVQPQRVPFEQRMTCHLCGCQWTAEEQDVKVGGFKISGYFFDDTAVVVEKYFVECPNQCDIEFVDYIGNTTGKA